MITNIEDEIISWNSVKKAFNQALVNLEHNETGRDIFCPTSFEFPTKSGWVWQILNGHYQLCFSSNEMKNKLFRKCKRVKAGNKLTPQLESVLSGNNKSLRNFLVIFLEKQSNQKLMWWKLNHLIAIFSSLFSILLVLILRAMWVKNRTISQVLFSSHTEHKQVVYRSYSAYKKVFFATIAEEMKQYESTNWCV